MLSLLDSDQCAQTSLRIIDQVPLGGRKGKGLEMYCNPLFLRIVGWEKYYFLLVIS